MTDSEFSQDSTQPVEDANPNEETAALPSEGTSMLREAFEAFDDSLASLEAAAEEALARGKAMGDMQNQIAALKADRDKLESEVATLRDEARQMEEITDVVSGRLDTAIRDIRSVLEA